MITEYKKINNKIIALDNEKGLIDYEYQDNIEDILKQENIIEELENSLYELTNEKDFFDKTKNSFNWMFFNAQYGMNAIFLLLYQH